MNGTELDKEMREHHDSGKALAQILGITPQTFCKKRRNALLLKRKCEKLEIDIRFPQSAYAKYSNYWEEQIMMMKILTILGMILWLVGLLFMDSAKMVIPVAMALIGMALIIVSMNLQKRRNK